MSTVQFSEALIDSINALDGNKKKLFEKQLKQWLEKKYQFNKVDQAVKLEGVLLTSAQQRLYAMCDTEQGYKANLVCQKITLTGKLDTEKLVKGLLLVTERHPAFKTLFKQGPDGDVLQWIDNRITHEVEQFDFSGAADANKQLAALELSHSGQKFDLENGPIFRFSLVSMSDESHILFFTSHNLVFDAWSYDIFIRELKHFYNTSVSGKKSSLQRNRNDFLDYVCWGEVWASGKRYKKQMDYWQHTIDFAHSDDLTLDFPRGEQARGYSGKRIEFTLPSELKNRLNDISKANSATFFMTSLAAITAFFSRTMSMKNISIGTISANRPRPEVENIIGYFLNLTPINTTVDTSSDSLLDILSQVKEQSLNAIENIDVYRESLVKSKNLSFDPLRNPFFDILFSFETIQGSESGFSGIKESYQDLDKGTARYDLTLSLYDDDDRFYGWIEYNTDLFKDETAQALTEKFTAWLEQITKQPEQALNKIG